MTVETGAEQTFEDALTRLEALVKAMESGELSLEDSMAHFEEGMTLAAFCSKRLAEAEKKIEILMKKADGALEWTDGDDLAPADDDPSDNGDAPF